MNPTATPRSPRSQLSPELGTQERNFVFSVAMKYLKDDDAAADVAQDALLLAHRHRDNFRGDARYSTWLYRIAHNVVYDWLRKKKVQGDNEFDDARTDHAVAAGAEAVPRGVPAPDKALGQAELGARIRSAIDTLSESQREVILLREVEGFSYEEIATATECSMGTVMSRLFYARKKLQEILHDIKP